ncbi:sensor histidine kinase [Paenibacillus pasadenensis]|uniref:sensor histidine kinase n=1 Tax=Paenibacillus pasadenensis TaxID=217090 RepID=UPI00203A5FAF|nr:sensor histidine kinase [Paenibacillus pasadenensis]MCM3749625.1 sensor histidine kinase [Paenibacillus pasadenensis]
MKVQSFYRTFIKNNLFTKLLATFSFISVLTIVTLAYLLYAFMADSVRSGIFDDQRQAIEAVNSRLAAKHDSAQRMISDVYSDQALSHNLSYLLSHSYADYIRYRIDRYSDEPLAGYANALTYFKHKTAGDSDIQRLLIYSSVEQYLFAWKPSGSTHLLEMNSALSYIPDAMALDVPAFSAPNRWVSKAMALEDERLYAVRVAVNNPGSLQKIGQLLVYYNSDGLLDALEGFKDAIKGYILVLTPEGQVLFDSSGRYYGARYPYAAKISSINASVNLEEPSSVSVLTNSAAGYSVVSVVPDSQLQEATAKLRRSVLITSIIGILIAILVPALAVSSVARRTGSLVRLMRRVESGDFAGRISDERGDELGQISQGFNRMLDQLNRHIEQDYKAEIRQRNTELSALQARINPHFLSNTLEVIRMRAVSQGADDVGEMIYSLSVLFRSMVGSQSMVPLREELELGRRYLELFRIRYKNRFSYTITMDEQLGGRPIIKLSLQPVIENYIVHGLDTERADNQFEIAASLEHGLIRITLRDNGRGIPPEQLDRLRLRLQLPSPPETAAGSFGLHSVGERLRLVYGQQAGMSVESSPGGGTTVALWFPDERDERNKRNLTPKEGL